MEPSELAPEAPLAPAPEPTPQTSVWSRMFNIFAAPGEVYDEVKVSKHSTGNWLWPALLLVLIGWMASGLILSNEAVQQQIQDMQAKAIEQRVEDGKMTQEQADAAIEAMSRFGQIGIMVTGIVTPVFAAFAGTFWWALLIWVSGSLVMKGGFPYLKAVEVAGLANMIVVLHSVIKTLLIMATGNLFAGPGLVLFVKEFDSANPVHSIMAAIDLLTFWVLLVRSIGLAKLSGKSVVVSAVWMFGLWAFFTACGIGFGVLMTRLFS